MRPRHLLTATCLVAALALTGCAAEATPTPSAASTPTATPTVPAPAEARPFVQPVTCATALPADTVATIEQKGLVLLGGPEGRYGTEYAADPSPEETAGGVTCIWGFADTEVSSITVSVAPLPAAARAEVVESLTEQGLNEGLDGDATVFWQEGDEDFQPAIYTALRADSWISVIETVGGPEAYDEAVGIAADAYEATHPAPPVG